MEEIKAIRVEIKEIHDKITNKKSEVYSNYLDYVEKNKRNNFFGMDSLHFQNKLIEIEYESITKQYHFVDNRMYCDYYKLFGLITQFLKKNYNDNFDNLLKNKHYPVYKDLEQNKVYDFNVMNDIHRDIIVLIKYLYEKVNSVKNEIDSDKQKMFGGLKIANYVYNFIFSNTVTETNVKLFEEYLDAYHVHHINVLKNLKETFLLMLEHLDPKPPNINPNQDDSFINLQNDIDVEDIDIPEQTVKPIEVVDPIVEPVVDQTVDPVVEPVKVIDPIVDSVVEPVEVVDPIVDPVVEPVVDPIVDPVVEPVEVVDPIVDSVVEPVEVVDPVVEPIEVIEPVVDPVVEPIEVIEPVVDPVVEPIEVIEPVVDPVVEPIEVIDPIMDPVVEPIELIEPVVDQTVDPVVEPIEVIDPIMDPVVEPIEVIDPIMDPVVEPVELIEPIVDPVVEPVEVIEPIVDPVVEPVEVVKQFVDTTAEVIDPVNDTIVELVDNIFPESIESESFPEGEVFEEKIQDVLHNFKIINIIDYIKESTPIDVKNHIINSVNGIKKETENNQLIEPVVEACEPVVESREPVVEVIHPVSIKNTEPIKQNKQEHFKQNKKNKKKR